MAEEASCDIMIRNKRTSSESFQFGRNEDLLLSEQKEAGGGELRWPVIGLQYSEEERRRGENEDQPTEVKLVKSCMWT